MKINTEDVALSRSRAEIRPEAENDGACEIFFADPQKVARVRASLIGSREVSALAETFRVLADPTRVRILDALSSAELCVCDLATLLGVSESAVSHQLRLLRGMRLVRSRRDGRMVFYSLDDHHVIGLFQQGLEHVEEAARGIQSAVQGDEAPAGVGRR